MKTAIYPGSFSIWHDGHTNVVLNAIQVFDRVIIAIGVNPKKIQRDSENPLTIGEQQEKELRRLLKDKLSSRTYKKIKVVHYTTLLRDAIIKYSPHAVIKGLRNAEDLEYETCQLYWNEDLGVTIPTLFVVCDRRQRHLSSSALRGLEKFK